MINYATILLFNYPKTQWSINNDCDYGTLEWHDNSPKPTKEELDGLWQATLDKINANAYIAKRASEYPPITDYIDGVVKGDQTQIDKYIADCKAVKARHPKS